MPASRAPHLADQQADAALLKRVAAGDSDALSELYERHRSAAYSLALRITRNSSAAEDVMQEAFLGVWRAAPRYVSGRGSVRTWTLAIVHHSAIDTVRRERPTYELPDVDAITPASLVTPDFWPAVAGRLDADAITAALARLSPVQRTAIELAYYGGFTQLEIAARTGAPLGTVKGRLRLGLCAIRDELAHAIDDGEPVVLQPVAATAREESRQMSAEEPTQGADGMLPPRPSLTPEQTLSDADQSASDADQTASDSDQSSADQDHRASAAYERSATADDAAARADQRLADSAHAAQDSNPAEDAAYDAAQAERETRSADREVTRNNRAVAATVRDRARHDRDETGEARDVTATARDHLSSQRDQRFRDLEAALGDVHPRLARELEELRLDAAADRARAAMDRDKAAQDRADAARERGRLEAELQMAHLDALTGAYRREMGLQALEHELARAQRARNPFVLAFVDIDELKAINERDGRAGGDRALQAVAVTLRSRLRSFDPVIRYGDDEFVCGAAGTPLIEATHRFTMIGRELEDDARVGVSVGLAAFEAGDSVAGLIARADTAMLRVKRGRRDGGLWRVAS